MQALIEVARAVVGNFQSNPASSDQLWRSGLRRWLAGRIGIGIEGDFAAPAPWYFRTLKSWVDLMARNGLVMERMIEPPHPETGKPASIIFCLWCCHSKLMLQTWTLSALLENLLIAIEGTLHVA